MAKCCIQNTEVTVYSDAYRIFLKMHCNTCNVMNVLNYTKYFRLIYCIVKNCSCSSVTLVPCKKFEVSTLIISMLLFVCLSPFEHSP